MHNRKLRTFFVFLKFFKINIPYLSEFLKDFKTSSPYNTPNKKTSADPSRADRRNIQ